MKAKKKGIFKAIGLLIASAMLVGLVLSATSDDEEEEEFDFMGLPEEE